MSQHIKQLEIELGAELFQRNGRDITPTLAGRKFYLDCIDVLKRLDAAQQNIGAHAFGQLRIGLMPTFTRSILPPVLEQFLTAMPDVEISIVEAYSGVLTDMTLKGDLDFAIVPAFEGLPGLTQTLVARDREMLIRARGQGDDDMQPVALSECAPLKVVLPANKNIRRRSIETYFSSNGVPVERRLEMDAMMGTLQFVASSDWVAILPFLMMAGDLDRERFEIRPLDAPPLYSEFVMIEPARRQMGAMASRFADMIRLEAERLQCVLTEKLVNR